MKSKKSKYHLIKSSKTIILSGLILIAGIILTVNGCIEEFEPKLKSSSDIIVIEGSIIQEDILQFITVSMASSLDDPEFRPVSQCQVTVIDKYNNRFRFYENEPGIYSCYIDEDFLTVENWFQLQVNTTKGEKYVSDTVSIIQSSEIDSLYYNVEYYQSSSTTSEKGLQFYADLKAPENSTKFFLWTVDETWEIRTFYKITGYYDRFHNGIYEEIIDSLKYCWSTDRINRFFTSSTTKLVKNEKKKIYLNHVDQYDPKLNFKYSILVKQYGLSETAYNYWNNINVASYRSGGIYQVQPSQSVTNIRNVNQPDELVLGLFWASSFTEKRIFFSGPLSYVQENCNIVECVFPCDPIKFMRGLGNDIVYFNVAEEIIINQECINCTAKGATTVKPDFWE